MDLLSCLRVPRAIESVVGAEVACCITPEAEGSGGRGGEGRAVMEDRWGLVGMGGGGWGLVGTWWEGAGGRY